MALHFASAQAIHSVLDDSDASLADRYRAVRAASEWLTDGLAPEDTVAQSMDEASPVKWHLAHTTWFFETFVLERIQRRFRPFNPAFRELFNSYYNSVGPQYRRPARGMISRPTLAQVHEYRRFVDQQMLDILSRADPLTRGTTYITEVGLHHEQQHQELILTDLKHLLSFNPLAPVYCDSAAARPSSVESGSMQWLRFDGGLYTVGHQSPHFAFDNETPAHRVYLNEFELATRPVTNGEFLCFMRDGGYRNPQLWLSDGWTQVQKEQWRAPLYWREHETGWYTFTLGGQRPVEPEEPVVHVSYYEADAYARWAGARLPSEYEWEVAVGGQAIAGQFVEQGRFHPGPAGDSDRLRQMYGDVWEWTRSPYAPYPGYRPPAGELAEYNGKFMCNQMVLRGGSCVTPQSHMRPTYRNFFYPPARWQFSGLRLARDAG